MLPAGDTTEMYEFVNRCLNTHWNDSTTSQLQLCAKLV